jgi:tetratricopeptide (TPR) repeat protein
MPNYKFHDNNLDERILRNHPSQSTAFLIVSEWYGQGRYDDVINACKDLLRIYPDDIRVHHLACLAYSKLDFQQQVLKETEEIMRSIEGFAEIYLLRAKALKRLNEPGKAFEALRLYLAYRPGDEAGLGLLQELKQMGLSPAPGEHESADTDVDSDTQMASATIAELYLSQGLIEEAVKTYRAVVALKPDEENFRRRLEELEMEASMLQESRHRQVRISADSVYRAVLEEWRERCRNLL